MTRSKNNLAEKITESNNQHCNLPCCNSPVPETNANDTPTKTLVDGTKDLVGETIVDSVIIGITEGILSQAEDILLSHDNLLNDSFSHVQYNTNDKEDNALERCKRNCEQGIFALEELLEVCRKNPDSILKAYRNNTHDENMPKFSGKCFTCEEKNNDFASIKQTHGEKFGDPKYHYLMVDVSTSISLLEEPEKFLQQGIRKRKQTANELRCVLVMPQEEEAEEEKQEEEKQEEKKQVEEKQEAAATNDGILMLKKESDSNAKETESDTTIVASLELNNNYHKRRSNVSWNELLGTKSPSRSPSATDSLEKIVLKATAKADKFRHSADIKKHYSLLGDIVREEKGKTQDSRKSSSSDNKSRESTPPPPPRRCFGLFKGKTVKEDVKKIPSKEDINEKNDEDKIANESEDSSRTDAKRHSSVDSYRRRSPPIERPIFEANSQMSKYLNNISPD